MTEAGESALEDCKFGWDCLPNATLECQEASGFGQSVSAAPTIVRLKSWKVFERVCETLGRLSKANEAGSPSVALIDRSVSI